MVTASEIYLHHVGHSPVLFTLGCYTLSTHLLMLLLLPHPLYAVKRTTTLPVCLL